MASKGSLSDFPPTRGSMWFKKLSTWRAAEAARTWRTGCWWGGRHWGSLGTHLLSSPGLLVNLCLRAQQPIREQGPRAYNIVTGRNGQQRKLRAFKLTDSRSNDSGEKENTESPKFSTQLSTEVFLSFFHFLRCSCVGWVERFPGLHLKPLKGYDVGIMTKQPSQSLKYSLKSTQSLPGSGWSAHLARKIKSSL